MGVSTPFVHPSSTMVQLFSRKTAAIAAFALVLMGQLSTGIKVPVASAQNVQTVTDRFAYTCNDSFADGQTCKRPHETTFTMSAAGTASATYKVAQLSDGIPFSPGPAIAGHCSSVRLHVSVDGQFIGTTPFLGYTGSPLSPWFTDSSRPLTTNLFSNLQLSAGSHTISVKGEGTVGGCNIGWLASLGGTITVNSQGQQQSSSSSSSSVPSCIPFTGSLRNISGLQKITFAESSGSHAYPDFFPEFTPNDTKILTDLSVEPYGGGDLNTTPGESYDFYYSNADGTVNTNGSYITIDNTRYLYSLANGQTANNINWVQLLFGNNQKAFAGLVASVRLGTGLSGDYLANQGYVRNALGYGDASDTTTTFMGDGKSSFTIGFCQNDIPQSSSSSSSVGSCQANDNKFATRVIDHSPVDPANEPPEAVLGAPDNKITDFNQTSSNAAGWVTVGFAPGVSIFNGTGPDLKVHVVDYVIPELPERFDVLVSKDGVSFFTIGSSPTYTTSTPHLPETFEFDIASSGLDQVFYVKIKNRHVLSTYTHEGPDIDSIEIVNKSCDGGSSSSSSSSSVISQCPLNLRHANAIIASTPAPSRGNPASTVLGAPGGINDSVNFDNDGNTAGYVKVGFPAPIVNGPGADFILSYEDPDEDFEVFVYDQNGNKASVGFVSRQYPYNTRTGVQVDMPFDISGTGFSSVVAVEVLNRENRASSDDSEGPDLRGFTSVHCGTQQSSSSSVSLPQCRDGIDNDGDGRIDYNNGNGDYGCDYNDDPTENPNPECSDGVDNGDPEDSVADAFDPGCHTDGDPYDGDNTYDPRDPSENNNNNSSSSSSSSSSTIPQCRDGIDNDGDGRVDYQNGNGDYGCDSNDDPTESPNPECSDGVDNGDPEDTLADQNDPGCYTNGQYNPRDPSENDNGSSSSASSANFDISVDDDEDEVEPEDDLTYVVEVTNKSNQSVNNVTVTVELDNDVNFDDCSNNCDDDDETITWTGLNFNGNETKYLTIDAEVDEDAEDGDELETEARVFNERDTDDTDVEEDDVKNDHDDDDADVEVMKDASTSEVFPGGMVQYTVKVRNTGDTDLEDITVTDTLPMGVQVIDDGNADRNSGGRLVWEIDRLAKGKTWTVSYRVSVPQWTAPGTILRNDVRVMDDEGSVNVNTMAIVSVIGFLPQTGGDVGGLFTMILSLVGAGAGIGLKAGKKLLV